MSNRANKLICGFCLVLLISACTKVQIYNGNKNQYTLLKPEEIKNIKSFDEKLINERHRTDSLTLYEIDERDIDRVLVKSKYTWIHFWNALCGSKTCINIGIYNEKANAHPEINFLMISESYLFKIMKKRVETSGFDRTVFVLKDSYYGHKGSIRKVGLHLNPSAKKSEGYYADYLFKGTTLVYVGYDLELKLDSIMRFYNNTSYKAITN